ncbi:MAG: hypothetical protein CVV39_05185 [Planctomycetes bacterium HGW-Planctomycetes-1]|nr:MAG: hypothetical protein CVV39_05185 [Planctomycetes bacterium HGW-Planctomycetes-1]
MPGPAASIPQTGQNWLEKCTNPVYKISFPFGHRFMTDQEQCENCGQKHNCQEIYRQMSHSKAPNVLSKVVQAFVVPLVIFIIALAVSEKLLAERLQSEAGKTLAALAISVSAVLLYLVILKLWRRKN